MQTQGRTVEFGNWVWECISDPTRRDDRPGDFYGGRFRYCDLRWSALARVWPEGIAFRHVHKGVTVSYRNGQLVQA